jgi:hypothetical protein
MRLRTRLLLAAAASAGLGGFASSADAARVLYYNFEDGTDATINNSGTTATAGTLTNSNNAAPDAARYGFVPGFAGNVAGIGNVNTGTALRLTPASQNNAPEDAYVRTNQTAPQLAASTGTYTMMAWANVANFNANNDGTGGNNDNMVFGQVQGGGDTGNTQFLHNGFRGNRIHQGHWGQDEERTGQDLSTNTWYHVAYVYQNNNMTQYVNGVAVSPDEMQDLGGGQFGDNPEGPLLNVNEITIGRTGGGAAGSGNNGNFNGFLDEVKMFDTALTPAQIAQEALVVVPEPASLGLLGVGALGLLARRRRSQA